MAKKKYEVFISFKNSDEKGNVTRDATIAENLHNFLDEYGVNAFFSKFDIVDSNYSDSIDRALEESKIMFIVATKKEFLESKWLKREYETYFNIHKDPIQICISPNIDLPTSLKRIQNISPDAEDYHDSVVSYCKRNDVTINESKYRSRKNSAERSKIEEKFLELEGINRTFNQKQYNAKRVALLNQLDEIISESTNLRYHNTEYYQAAYYAKSIQESLLAREKDIKALFHDQQIELYYRPQYLVGGDFYWFHREGNKLLMVCADATGYAVPGAFMALMGNTLLKKIVIDEGLMSPAAILNKMSEDVKYLLRINSESTNQDGFDMSIVCVDIDKKQIEFAGAQNSMYLIRNMGKLEAKEGAKFEINTESGDLLTLTEYKANKRPVGFFPIEREFQDVTVSFESRDRVFLATDGYPVQFGGPNNRKYLPRRFKHYILETSSVSLTEQFKMLVEEFDQWKGEEQQIDDVLVMGVEVA